MLGQKGGPEGGGVEIVEARLDVEEEGGDPESGPLKGPDFVGEGETWVKGTESWKGAALVRVEQTSGASDCGQPDCHNSFKDL